MAVRFFKTLEEIKNWVGGRVDSSIDVESIAPDVEFAITRHLVDFMGEDLVDKLAEQYDDYVATPATGGGVYNGIFPLFLPALAHLGLFEYAKTASIHMSSMGMVRQESEHHRTAYKYQENEYKNHMLRVGYSYFEKLTSWIGTKAKYQTIPELVASEKWHRSRELFINDSATFRLLQSQTVDRYTFEILRPVMRDVEVAAIEPILGEEFFADIKTKILNDSLAGKEITLVEKIRPVVAHLSIDEGIGRHLVKLEGVNVIENVVLDSAGYIKKQVPKNAAIQLAMRDAESWGNRHVRGLLKYLDENQDDFPLWEPDPSKVYQWTDAEGNAWLEEDGSQTTSGSGSLIEEESPKPIIHF